MMPGTPAVAAKGRKVRRNPCAQYKHPTHKRTQTGPFPPFPPVPVVISDVEHAVLDGTLNRGHVGKGERLSKGRLRKGRLRLRWNRRDVSDGTERCQHMPAYPSPVPSPSSSLESSIRRGIAKNNNEQHKTREGRDPTTAFLLLVPLQATVGTAGPGVSFRSRLSSPTALSSKPKQGDGVALAT